MPLLRRAISLAWEAPQTALGPLYLPVVGLPSISRAAYALVFRELTGTQWARYYEGYPENWADRLRGVVREKEQS